MHLEQTLLQLQKHIAHNAYISIACVGILAMDMGWSLLLNIPHIEKEQCCVCMQRVFGQIHSILSRLAGVLDIYCSMGSLELFGFP